MGVPTHRIEIRKSYQGNDWANDYLIESPTMDFASAFGIDTVEFERQLHNTNVTFVYMRCSTVAQGDRIFRHVDLNLPGTGFNVGTNLLPLYNTLRVDLRTTDSDPCRKYFRVPLHESMQDNGVIDATSLGVWQSILSSWIAGFEPDFHVVSGAGHDVVGGSIHPIVQMRQLHRHKRPVAP